MMGLRKLTQNKSGPPAAMRETDYEAIEAAVMETARGRWFLAEFARRNRSADTETLLEAIHKLQLVLQDRQPPDELSHLRRDIMEMAAAMAQTRRDLAAIAAAKEPESGFELDSIVATTEKASADILGAAEQVQEIAWTLREQGVTAEPCDALDAHATDIYAACSAQDLTRQRIGKLIAAFGTIEKRLNHLVRVWGLDDIEIRSIEAPAGVLPQAGDVAAKRPAEAPREPQTGEVESLELFDRLAADLEAAMRLAGIASPAAGRSGEPPADAAADAARPLPPEAPSAERQHEDADLARLSPAHKTALFT